MKILGYFFVIVLLGACNNSAISKPKKPKNLIKKEVMSNIIYDMVITTSAKGINKKLIEAKGVAPDSLIYSKYNVDSMQFALSNAYYSYHLDTYDDIYERVKARLTLEKKELDSLVKEETNKRSEQGKEQRLKRDSLNKVRANEKKGKTTNLNPLKKVDTLTQLTPQ